MKKINLAQKNRGFTFVELAIAMSLFGFISIIMVSLLVSTFDATKKARANVKAMDALSFALDSMVRELRVGKNFDCAGGVNIPGDTGDCPLGADRIGFTNSEGEHVRYRFYDDTAPNDEDDWTIARSITTTGPWVTLVGTNLGSVPLEITDGTFYVMGSGSGDDLQPKVVIVIQGIAGTGRNAEEFTIQTTVTQRFPDF